MLEDEMEPTEGNRGLTPKDGFDLVVRLMRRVIERQEHRFAVMRNHAPYRFSDVRMPMKPQDDE